MTMEMYKPHEIEIKITDSQLGAAIEAVHDALILRIKWAVVREPHFATLDFEIPQEVISELAEVYTTLMFAARDLPSEIFHPEFFNMFNVGPEMWNLANSLIYGTSWNQVPIHPHMPGDPARPVCKLCDQFELV